MRLPQSWLRGSSLAFWPVLELMVVVAAQFVLTPLLLHRLGPEQFGVWVLVQSMLVACSVMSLGASTGLLPVLSAVVHRGDRAGAAAALSWLMRRTAVVSAVMVAGGLIALERGVLPDDLVGGRDGAWLLVLSAVVWMAATELDGALASSLKACGKFAFAARLEAAARFVQVALIALVVDGGSQALLPVLVSLAVTIGKLVFRLLALHKEGLLTPQITRAASPTGDVSRDLARTSAWLWIGLLGSLTFNAFDRWFVGAWFGASVLAAYAICVQLAQMPHAIAAAAGQVLVPWAARQGRPGPGTDSDRRTLKILGWTTALAALPSLVLLRFIEPLLGLWISPAFAAEHLELGRQLTLVFLLLSLNVPAYFLLLGLGYPRFSTVVIGVSGLLFVVGAMLLPRDLSTFVNLKAFFALLSLALPVGCALVLILRARSGR
jgi:O-antigen/teichoic acid export membrane protein